MPALHTFLPVIALTLIGTAVQCTSLPKTVPGDLFESLPAGGKKIRYISRDYSPEEFSTVKSREAARLKDNLKILFNENFDIITSKYINVSHRCLGKNMNTLLDHANIFFREVYPKYFRERLKSSINVVYFRDREEFLEHTGTEYYGFYGPGINTFFTYCSTGYGTLWHELMHAFLHNNTAAKPQYWFDEGLASFYVLADIQGAGIAEGFANWKMELLHDAMRNGTMVHLREMVRDRRFPEDPGFSQARLFFCYLWIHKKLTPFVQTYVYELLPRYKGEELAEAVITVLEDLMGKGIEEINREYLELAGGLKNREKLYQK